MRFHTIIIPINTKIIPNFINLQLRYRNDHPLCTSMFFISMMPHLPQSAPILKWTFIFSWHAHNLKNLFYNGIALSLLYSSGSITFGSPLYPPSAINLFPGSNLFYSFELKIERSGMRPKQNVPINQNKTSTNTRPNLPEKYSMIHFSVHHFLLISFTCG